MMGEIVTRNMQSKAIEENKNAIVASCWTYFTAMQSTNLGNNNRTQDAFVGHMKPPAKNPF